MFCVPEESIPPDNATIVTGYIINIFFYTNFFLRVAVQFNRKPATHKV